MSRLDPEGSRRSACSSINIVNNGYSVFGKNLDNSYTTGGLILINKRHVRRWSRYTSTTGARAQWVSRFASVNFSFVHVGFVWTGMNEKGLVISMMGIAEAQGPPPDHRPPLVDGQWIQYMLDTCVTVEEVLAAAEDFRIITVDHYHIADRYGNSAVVEFLGGVKHVYTGEDLPVSAITNSTYAHSIADWEQYLNAPFPAPNGSIGRFRVAAEHLGAFEPTDPSSAVDYAFHTLHSIRSQLFYGPPNTTQWSFVFDTHDLRVYYKTHTHPEMKYFELNDFDLSCEEPVQMLDIQADLAGDVAPHFDDLTFEAACEHYRDFLVSFQGQNPSDSEVENEVAYYMSFPCEPPANTPRSPRGRVF